LPCPFLRGQNYRIEYGKFNEKSQLHGPGVLMVGSQRRSPLRSSLAPLYASIPLFRQYYYFFRFFFMALSSFLTSFLHPLLLSLAMGLIANVATTVPSITAKLMGSVGSGTILMGLLGSSAGLMEREPHLCTLRLMAPSLATPL